jgi:hypothetical protein
MSAPTGLGPDWKESAPLQPLFDPSRSLTSLNKLPGSGASDPERRIRNEDWCKGRRAVESLRIRAEADMAAHSLFPQLGD